jgi:hypothetical protein
VYVNSWNNPEDGSLASAETCCLKYQEKHYLINNPTKVVLDYIIHGVSKNFGEWYQKTNKTKETNK